MFIFSPCLWRIKFTDHFPSVVHGVKFLMKQEPPVCRGWRLVGWLLVGCFGFNDPLRQYFSLYRVVSQREEERGEWIEESKNVQTTPTRTYCKRNRPLPYYHPNCRTPRHWKLTQDHRTTRPPPCGVSYAGKKDPGS